MSELSHPSHSHQAPKRKPRRLPPVVLNALVIVAVFVAGIGADRTLLNGGLLVGAADTFTEHEDFDV
ncbi:MAG TPA: hypothetical protein VHG52_15460, partial [Thermomicrobiales bacterium]|nr:hypothetical protein [Thermomicrobiales bacterium]